MLKKVMAFTDMEISTAEWIGSLSNVVLVLGAILALLGTAGSIWASAVKDIHGDKRRIEHEGRTAEALKASALANERAESLKQSNSKLEIELERERVARLRLEERVKPRRLSEVAKTKMRTLFSMNKPAKISLHCGVSDGEAYVLMRDIHEIILEYPAWKGSPEFGMCLYDRTPIGIEMKVNPMAQHNYSAIFMSSQLAKVFHKAGLIDDRVRIGLDKSMAINEIRIDVGTKPA